MRYRARTVRLTRARFMTTTAVIALVGGSLALLIVVKVLGAPDGKARLAARDMGGEYLGTDGVVLQGELNDCGPAALKMVLDQQNKGLRLQEIARAVESREAGSSMLALKKAAKSFGARVEGWRLSLTDLRTADCPLILFVQGRHFVVLDSLDRSGSLYLRDPAIGRMKMPHARLAEIWSGESLVFQREHRWPE